MFVPYSVKSGCENMQIDSDILEDCIKNKLTEPVFRLYGWKPACISLGRNQKDDFLDKTLLNEYKIDVVRRLTGGRALLHDNEITYSYVCPLSFLKNGENVIESYKEISQILINGFYELGIKLEFGGEKISRGHVDYCMLVSTGADLCFKNKKLIGSAQFRKNGYILQHGSILYDYNKDLLEKIFKEKVDNSHVTTISEINSKITKSDIISVFENLCK